MKQPIILFIALLITASSHGSAPSDAQQKNLQKKCVTEVQIFLADEGYRARTEARNTQNSPSSKHDTGQVRTAKLSPEKRQQLQAACVANVKVLLQKLSPERDVRHLPWTTARTRPRLNSKEDMIEKLKAAGYTVRSGAVINQEGYLVTHTDPFTSFREWYLEWQKSNRSETRSQEKPFSYAKEDFPPLS